jgi:hypothetical protein
MADTLPAPAILDTGGGAVIQGSVTAETFVGRDQHLQQTIHQYFVEGLGRLVNNYSSRIENFLFEYLGSNDQPVPFGGRQAQLAELDAWLADPNAPPYLLMVAEAGGGKSALVTRWAAHLASRGALAVVFVPISIRFQTAAQDVAFAALAARLAQIYEQQANLPAALSAEQWKAQCESYLRLPVPAGQQVVVVIDGLDEATGWRAGPELFAKRPPPGLRVVVTARSRAKESNADRWAALLGWQEARLARKLKLPALDRPGVADALASMGNPLDHLAGQVDLVGELYRLSEGDPLLVRLYVDALRDLGAAAARLRPADLATLEPGLDGFMQRWWADQRRQWQMQGKDPLAEEERLLPLLNACTLANGPLLLNDLAALDSQPFGRGLLVSHQAELLGRWVIGDGKQQGYVFSHPRLRDYFAERLTPVEASAWQAKFCAWGERVLQALNSGALTPKAAPEYLLRYYATHLQQSHAPAAAFYALVSNGWRLAWEELDISYGGFLGDVERAWAQARAGYAADQPGKALALVQQIKAALCKASIVAMGSNIQPELLAQAVAAGLRTPVQALAITQLAPTPQQQSAMLSALAAHLPPLLLGEAFTIACSIADESSRAEALRSLAPHLPAELLGEALTAVRAIKDKDYRAAALRSLAPRLPAELLGEALTAVRAIADESYRVDALRNLAPHLPAALLREALTAVRAIADESYRAYALLSLAPHLPAEEHQSVLHEALTAARAIAYENSRVEALRSLVPHLPAEEHQSVLHEALTAARAIAYENYRVEALRSLVPHLPAEEHQSVLREALAAVRAIKHKSSHAAALCSLVPHLPAEARQSVLREALTAVRAIAGDSSHAKALRSLAPHLPAELLREALTAVRAIKSESDRAYALSSLAPHLPAEERQSVLCEALTAARAIADEDSHAAALSSLAPHLPAELLGEALTAVRAIKREYSRAAALRSLAPHLPAEERQTVLREALTAARAIADEDSRVEALSSLAPHLPAELLGEALTAVRAIEHEYDHAKALSSLAPHLPAELLGEALTAVRAIAGKSSRAKALRSLAPHLPAEEHQSVLREALAAVRAIAHVSERAYALSSLAPHLPAEERQSVLHEALAAVRAIADEDDRAYALGSLAPHLPELLGEALTAVRAIAYEDDRAYALSSLAPHLPAELLGEALTAVRAIVHVSEFAYALSSLAPHLPAELWGEALTNVRAIGHEYYRAKALSSLAHPLATWLNQRDSLVYRIWVETLSVLAASPRPQFLRDLTALMPFLLALAGDEAAPAAEGIYHAIQEVCGWWP